MKRKLFTFAVLATVAVGGAFAGTANNQIINADTPYLDAECNPVVCGEYQTPLCAGILLYAEDDCEGTEIFDASGNINTQP